MERIRPIGGVSRRTFLHLTGAVALFPALSGPAAAKATFQRKNVADVGAAQDLTSYKVAVDKMLKLPPDDPRNWYRLAVTHLIDCPHGNWWFFPWHRAFLGWFEQTCRELSEDPKFALPYWDWTASPRIPASLFGNVLDPTTDDFLKDNAAFKVGYEAVIKKLWDNATAKQQQAFTNRGYATFDDLWNQLMGSFVPRVKGRTLTAAKPDLPTPGAVKLPIVEQGLLPKKYVDVGTTGFSSPLTPNHSGYADDAIIEGIPHNMVHNDIGGNMPTMLSPIDPIFYLHHCNIDRLWDVWATVNKDTPNEASFKDEEFLFFVDAKGQPVVETKTSHYIAIGAFDYDYQPGSGTVALVLAEGEATVTSPRSASGSAPFGMDTAGTLAIPLVDAGERLAAAPAYDVMLVTFLPPAHGAASGVRFNIFLSAAEPTRDLTIEDGSYVTSVSLFGHSFTHEASPVTFTVPVRDAMGRLAERGEISAATPTLYVSVMAEEIHKDTVADREAVVGELLSVAFANR